MQVKKDEDTEHHSSDGEGAYSPAPRLNLSLLRPSALDVPSRENSQDIEYEEIPSQEMPLEAPQRLQMTPLMTVQIQSDPFLEGNQGKQQEEGKAKSPRRKRA